MNCQQGASSATSLQLLELISDLAARSPRAFLALAPLPDTWEAQACFPDLLVAPRWRCHASFEPSARKDLLVSCIAERSSHASLSVWMSGQALIWSLDVHWEQSCAEVMWGCLLHAAASMGGLPGPRDTFPHLLSFKSLGVTQLLF